MVSALASGVLRAWTRSRSSTRDRRADLPHEHEAVSCQLEISARRRSSFWRSLWARGAGIAISGNVTLRLDPTSARA